MNKTSGGVDGAPVEYLGDWVGGWCGDGQKKLDTSSLYFFYAKDVDDVFWILVRKFGSKAELLRVASEARWKQLYHQMTKRRPRTGKKFWDDVFDVLKRMMSRDVDREFDPERLRKIGIWRDCIGGEYGLVYNNGDKLCFMPDKGDNARRDGAFRTVGLYQPPQIYRRAKCPCLELDWDPDGDSTPLSTEDSARVLSALQTQPWAGDAQLEGAELAGWIYSSLFTALPSERRPQVWLTGTMTIAKRVLVRDMMNILGIGREARTKRRGFGVMLSPYFTDATGGGMIKRDLGCLVSDTTAPVIYVDDGPQYYFGDERAKHRRRILKFMYSWACDYARNPSFDHDVYGWYRLHNNFCLVTDERLESLWGGEVLLTELRLKDTTRAREEKLAAALVEVRKMIDAPEFTARFILRCMMVYPIYRASFTLLTAFFAKKFEHKMDYLNLPQLARHAQLIAGAHAMRADEPMTVEEMAGWAEMVRVKMRRENEASRAEWEKYLSRRR